MSDQNNKLVTGEVVEEIREAGKRGGVFIGTLNIMTEPARNFITEPLLNVYKSRYEGKFKRPKHVFAFDAGLILLGAALAIIAIYFGFIFKPFDPVQIQLVAAPKSPATGSEIVLNLNVSNMSDSAMRNTVVIFKLPKEIAFVRSSLPYTRDEGRVMLGLIDSKTDADERLVGKLSGPVGKEIKASATVTYTDEKTGQSISKNAAVAFKIMSSTVGAEFDLPASILVGQTFTGDIRYFNRGNDTAKNVVIVPEWPNGFTLASSDPALKNGRWEVGTLAPGSENKINFTGVIDPSATEADFALTVNGAQSLKTVALANPQISVTMSGSDKARLGDTIDLVANYRNDGDRTITNASIKVMPEDGLTVVSIGDLVANEVALPADIKPGANGRFNIKVRIANALPEAVKNSSDVRLNIRTALVGKLDNVDSIMITSPAYGIKIASTLGLASLARYWSESGDQLGRGPMPPAVGQATRYWIFWSVKNTTGAVNNVRVSAQLPANVGFTGKASLSVGDALEYDPVLHTLTWNIGDVPAWPGITQSAVSAGFELSLIPTPDQIGTYPTLIMNQKVNGTDAATGLNLGDASPDLNSKLSLDPKAAGLGPVK